MRHTPFPCLSLSLFLFVVAVSTVEADDAIIKVVLDKTTTELGGTCSPIQLGYTIQPVYVSLVVQNLSDRPLAFKTTVFYPYRILKASVPTTPPKQVVSGNLWSVRASSTGADQVPPHGSIVLARATLPYFDPGNPLATFCFPSTGSYILSVDIPKQWSAFIGEGTSAEAAFFVVPSSK